MKPNAEAIVAHLYKLYETNAYTDAVINIFGRSFHVHKVILAMSGYFAALMSSTWGGLGSEGDQNQRLEFNLDCSDTDVISASSFETMIKYLYGQSPSITAATVHPLLVTGSFFDVATLCSLVSDYVFANLAHDNVVDYLLLVHNKEYGEPGKLIEDASFAYLHRNAVDIGAPLHRLPMHFQTEFQRYKLAVLMKRATRRRIQMEQARCFVPSHQQATLPALGVRSVSDIFAQGVVASDVSARDAKLPAVYRAAAGHSPAVTVQGLVAQSNAAGQQLLAPPPSPVDPSGGGVGFNPSGALRVDTGAGVTASTESGGGTQPVAHLRRSSSAASSIAETPPMWTTSASSMTSASHASEASNGVGVEGDLEADLMANSASISQSASGAVASDQAMSRHPRTLLERAAALLQPIADERRAVEHASAGAVPESVGTARAPPLDNNAVRDEEDDTMIGIGIPHSHNYSDSIFSTPGDLTAPGDAGGPVRSSGPDGSFSSPGVLMVSVAPLVNTASSSGSGQTGRSLLSVTNASKQKTASATVIKASVPPPAAGAAPPPGPTLSKESSDGSLVQFMSSSPTPGARDFTSELQELEDTYSEIFKSFRFVHMTSDQLAEVQADGEVHPEQILRQAVAEQERMYAKLRVAKERNVKRLSEMDAMAEGGDADAAAVREVKWPSFRFGVEVAGTFSEAMAPSAADGQPTSMSSERVYFAGSLWCLDLKRYNNPEEGQEYVAVYLRRRKMSASVSWRALNPDSVDSLFEDTRDRTTMGFSIRLCGAPGAPTSNSVCGRSVMGKAFGCDAEQSWGWESYISLANLTEKPWNCGDKLRFILNLDML